MCYVCCKEFKGWCKSFTRIEAALSALEAVLLVVLISFLVFLILHFVVCSKSELDAPEPGKPETPPNTSPTPNRLSPITLPPQIECTWKPSEKTSAITHYYISDDTAHVGPETTTALTRSDYSTGVKRPEITDKLSGGEQPAAEYEDVFIEESDGEYADGRYKKYVLALVKLKPPGDLTFGCILTIITKHWTLTAASCIEAIEEVDTLDSFFMIEEYGEERQGGSHALSDVQIHPLYQGANRSYDLAALKSADVLMRGAKDAVELPNLVDYFLVAIGERFIALGYGGFRTIDKSRRGRSLRQVSVFTLPSQQCASGDESWATRHLVPAPESVESVESEESAASAGSAARHGACGAAPVCAGALFARGTPCSHCAGTPLLRKRTLYGLMSDNRQCGVTCEPQLYVNLAVARDWLDSILD